MTLIDQYIELLNEFNDVSVVQNLASIDSSYSIDFVSSTYSGFKTKYLLEVEEVYLGRNKEINEVYKKLFMPIISTKEREKIYDIESYEREMILGDLKFATHIAISKFNEPITSRRFVAINDSCMSFTQVTVDKNHYRWNFISRSTEVNKMLPADFQTIGYIIHEWTKWFRDYTQIDNDNKGVKLVIILTNPHYYTK